MGDLNYTPVVSKGVCSCVKQQVSEGGLVEEKVEDLCCRGSKNDGVLGNRDFPEGIGMVGVRCGVLAMEVLIGRWGSVVFEVVKRSLHGLLEGGGRDVCLRVVRRILGVEKRRTRKTEEVLLRHGTEMSLLEFE